VIGRVPKGRGQLIFPYSFSRRKERKGGAKRRKEGGNRPFWAPAKNGRKEEMFEEEGRGVVFLPPSRVPPRREKKGKGRKKGDKGEEEQLIGFTMQRLTTEIRGKGRKREEGK